MDSVLSPQIARSLLKESLAEGGCEPSNGLAFLFEAAGAIAERSAPGRGLVSSRLLVFAFVELLNPDDSWLEPLTAEEKATLSAACALITRNREQLETQLHRYFAPENQHDDPSAVASMSIKVHELLVDLANKRRRESDHDNIVSAADFLLAFPPPGGLANELLEQLGTGLEELHSEIVAALDAGDNDWVATYRDEPAEEDELGRLAFAQVVADRIREARPADPPDSSHARSKPSSFMVHLHGPWGAGKSSILNFLEAQLKESPERWIVVKFNAWRDQRLQPPWWSLITTIYADARASLVDDFELARLEWRWLLGRLRIDLLPIIAVIACLALAGILITVGIAAPTNAPFSVFTSAIPLVAAVYLGSRSLIFGSQQAAQVYTDLKTDPYKPITDLFNTLMGAIPRPVVVFIDDLDRCEGKYVVELLEGIQTLMRGSTITYVVAADRKWICSSFEQRYKDFTPPVGEPGRPLGYLFLDKLFQISVAIPQLADDQQRTYWRSLLKDKDAGHGGSQTDSPEPVDRKEAEAKAIADVAQLKSQKELRAYVATAEKEGNNVLIRAARAAAARRIASPDAARETEHRLRDFAPLLEPNPRAMKRLVNAYGMHQASQLLAGRPTDSGPLARWTIIELRWPLLAEFLALKPDWVKDIARKLDEDEMPEVPKDIRVLFGDEFVRQAVEHGVAPKLTPAAIREILGSLPRE